MKNFFSFLRKLNVKTIYFNFKYLPFSQALRLPILVSKRVWLKKVAGKLTLDCPIKTGIVQIGYGNVGIFDKKRSRSIWEVSGITRFKGKCNIGHGCKISVGELGYLEIGEHFVMTAESSIVAHLNIKIGNNCLFSWNILIMDTDFHTIKDFTNNVVNNPKPILIGNKVWIGCSCVILKGATIPDNCVIGASSLIQKPLLGSNSIYGGNPCRLIKNDIFWEK